jgi:hypothetical protein
MDSRTFDTWTRRAAQTLSRRSALGVVTGTVLAIPGSLLGALAKKGGKKGKKKRCRAKAIICFAAVEKFCNETYFVDPGLGDLYDLCVRAFGQCCLLYKECKEAKGDACFAGTPAPAPPPPPPPPPPACCADPANICCPAGSVTPCCPTSFPSCPRAGSAGQCCPADNPIACQNGSCSRQGLQCCTNNPGSCLSGDTCCPNGCCPNGGVCCAAGCCPANSVCDEANHACILSSGLSAASRRKMEPVVGAPGSAR